jgi:hypothetical protein
MEIARKLSGATLTQGRVLKSIEKEVYLGRIYGVTESVESVETPFGVDADKFNGEFVCIKENGDQVTAPVCYLPPVVSSLTANAAKQGAPVKFGFDFFAVPSEKSKTGYTWKAQPLMEFKQSESLLAFAHSFPALPDAKPDAKPDARADHRADTEAKAKPKAK